jgi:hypothetical protein
MYPWFDPSNTSFATTSFSKDMKTIHHQCEFLFVSLNNILFRGLEISWNETCCWSVSSCQWMSMWMNLRKEIEFRIRNLWWRWSRFPHESILDGLWNCPSSLLQLLTHFPGFLLETLSHSADGSWHVHPLGWVLIEGGWWTTEKTAQHWNVVIIVSNPLSISESHFTLDSRFQANSDYWDYLRLGRLSAL